MTKIETWLPIFPGFYNTIFEANLEDELYYQNSQRDEHLPKIEYDDIDFDNSGYEADVVEQCTDFIEGELKDFVTSIKFQKVVSPREYNFKNDAGDIEIELSDENITTIKNYIYAHQEDYEQYLKRYKSYDGFMSWYGYEFQDWVEYTNDFNDYSQESHYLGSVLEFICLNEGIDQEAMYYSLEVYVGDYCNNRRTQLKCSECGEWYEAKDSPEHKEYERTMEKQIAIWKETQGDKSYKLKTFKEVYPEFSYKCEYCK